MGFQKQRIRGDAFMRLLGWELRHLRGRKPAAWSLAGILVALAIAFTAWWAAGQPDQENNPAWLAHAAAAAVLVLTPLHDPVARLGQMAFGYRLLRFTADFAVTFARLVLPALAAGTVVGDRRTGRLVELQLTGLSAAQIYMAKSLATALLFLAPALWAFLPFAGVLVLEAVPASEVARLSVEVSGQVLLTAMVTVALSAASRSIVAAVLKAYAALWIAVPVLWILLGFAAFVVSGGPPAFGGRFGEVPLSPEVILAAGLGTVGAGCFIPWLPVAVDFRAQCILQAAFTGLACLAEFLVGAKRLSAPDPGHGFRGRMRSVIGPLARLLRAGGKRRGRAAKAGGEHARSVGGTGV